MSPSEGRKRVLLVLAGAADPPGAETPLVLAETPTLDRMARFGRPGCVDLGAGSPWEGFTALLGAGAAAPSLGAAEAAGSGVEFAPGECAYRADFVTVAGDALHDPFGGKVKDPEAAALLEEVRAAAPGVRLARLGGHRNVAVLPGPAQFCPSPWEMVGRPPLAGLPPEGPVRALYEASARALAAHDVNAVRVDLAENPATALWLHGGGPPAGRVEPPAPLRGRAVLVGRGAATTGLAHALGWEASAVEGDDEVLAAAALAALASADVVVVRTESPLDASAHDDPRAKRDALSAADARLVAPLLGAIEEREDWVLAVAADSVIDTRTHALVRRAAPVVVRRSGAEGSGMPAFTEWVCETSGLHLASPAEFVALLA